MHKGGEKPGTGDKASKAMGAIAKLRANNSELAAALQSKKQECEDLKVENLELKNEVQVLNQKRIAMGNALNKCRPLLIQVALHWMNAEESLLEFQKEFDICNGLENADDNTTVNAAEVAARAKKFRDQYSAKKDELIAAAGDNLSVIIERSTLTDESPTPNSLSKPSGSGLQAGGSIANSKATSLLPRTNIPAKPKPVKGKKPSKVVAKSTAALKTKYKQPKAKKILTKTCEKPAVVLPPEEMPAFRPTFQIPRTPSKDDVAKEVSKSPLKFDNVICHVTRLTSPQIRSRIASLPEKAASSASVRMVSFAGTEKNDDGKINTTFDKTPIPAGTLAETARPSPRSLRTSIPFSLDESRETNAAEIEPIPSLDTAGPSNGVNKSKKVKKPRKKAEPKKKQENGPKDVQIENPAAETGNVKRVEKRKSRRNTLIEEENFNIPSPKVTPSPKKKKTLDDSAGKRPRRAASAVVYKEPNVNRKMRRN